MSLGTRDSCRPAMRPKSQPLAKLPAAPVRFPARSAASQLGMAQRLVDRSLASRLAGETRRLRKLASTRRRNPAGLPASSASPSTFGRQAAADPADGQMGPKAAASLRKPSRSSRASIASCKATISSAPSRMPSQTVRGRSSVGKGPGSADCTSNGGKSRHRLGHCRADLRALPASSTLPRNLSVRCRLCGLDPFDLGRTCRQGSINAALLESSAADSSRRRSSTAMNSTDGRRAIWHGSGDASEAEHLAVFAEAAVDVGPLDALHAIEAEIFDIEAGHDRAVGQASFIVRGSNRPCSAR